MKANSVPPRTIERVARSHYQKAVVEAGLLLSPNWENLHETKKEAWRRVAGRICRLIQEKAPKATK